MPEKKKKASDFRYDTGEARIPWAAVGEPVNASDLMAIIQLLAPPGDADPKAYRAQLAKVRREVEALAKTARPSSKLTLGGAVARLEAAACKRLGVKYAAFLTNATAGFEIGFKFAGLQLGDEVIAPAITFIATIAYPLAIGAKVVLADVDPRTLNMDPADVERKITPKTKAVIPVHLGGYPADMAPIMRLARKHGLTVIEDAAHAFGARYRGKAAGAVGHFGSYSFHEVKNITSLGEGGLLVTNTAFGKQFPQARFLGLNPEKQIPLWLYDVTALRTRAGYAAAGNHSATEIQAAALLSQMKRLDKILAQRRAAAEYLNKRFAGVKGLITPIPDTKTTYSTHHLYLIQIDPDEAGGDVQQFKAKLTERGVVQIPHFAPLYKFSLMRQLGYDTEAIQASCPVAERAFTQRFTHLPLYKFSRADLKYMADAVIDSVKELGR